MNAARHRSNLIQAINACDTVLQTLLVELATSESYAFMTDVVKLRQQLERLRRDSVEVFDGIEDT